MVLGKVYLVGAGPGNPKLLTLRAAELIETAKVLVYDRLVGEEILTLSNEHGIESSQVADKKFRLDKIRKILGVQPLSA